ncbi:hypothetical protein KX729_07865 [Rhizobium sp. XQZ8]|uniref:DUF6891 domain-containing protein n=1 Tax=Rhizobium populisoli TaxID=2859785 RepID=UPI001CA50A0D|nr:hypothetical protein [Rhizobium populisoli]MBW6421354.1 hypothetical protein [Rhizobium populisoli]
MLELLKILLARWFPPKPVEPAEDVPAMIDRQDAAVEIRRLVWSGFEPQDAVLDIVLEGYPASAVVTDIDRQWLRADIDRQFGEKRDEERSWPAQTDWDRLDAAFVELRASGIVALHDAGMTQSDGFADVAEEFQMRREVNVASSGFVFYGGEDVQAALSDEELYLTFGAFEKRNENTPAIAREITAALTKQGLRSSWSGDIGKRMLLSPFEWQKRSPEGETAN